MSKRHTLFARTAAAVTTLGAAISGAVVLAAAPATASGLQETNYTFQTSNYGTRVVAEMADLRSDRTAWAVMACTRLAGKYEKVSQASLDSSQAGNPLVDIGAVRSTKQTYVDKANGVQAAILGTNSVGTIKLGTSDTPLLSIDALKSSALSWVDTNGKFHAETNLTIGGIHLDLLGDTPIDDALQQLLDAIDQVQSTINETGKAVGLDPILSVLANNDGSIEIPGLGRVYLPTDYFHREIVKQRKGTAQASVKAMRILLYGTDGVEGGGDDSEIVIGRAWSRISQAPSGVMAGNGYGISAQVMQGVIGIGRVAYQPLPCWGTDGNTRSQQTLNFDFLKQGNFTTGNVLGRVLGAQYANGSAKAWTVGKVAGISLSLDGTPETTLSIDAVKAQANLRELANGKLVPAGDNPYGLKFGDIEGTYIGKVTFAGTEYEFAPGDAQTFFDSMGNPLFTIKFGEVTPLKRGLEVVAAHIYIAPDQQSGSGLVDIKLGVAKTRIKKY